MAGVVEGLAPRERRLPPPEGLGGGVRRRSGGARVICDHVHLGSKPAELDVKSSREVGNYNMYTEAQLQLIPLEKHLKAFMKAAALIAFSPACMKSLESSIFSSRSCRS